MYLILRNCMQVAEIIFPDCDIFAIDLYSCSFRNCQPYWKNNYHSPTKMSVDKQNTATRNNIWSMYIDVYMYTTQVTTLLSKDRL